LSGNGRDGVLLVGTVRPGAENGHGAGWPMSSVEDTHDTVISWDTSSIPSRNPPYATNIDGFPDAVFGGPGNCELGINTDETKTKDV